MGKSIFTMAIICGIFNLMMAFVGEFDLASGCSLLISAWLFYFSYDLWKDNFRW